MSSWTTAARPDLATLALFLEVVECGSIRRAASNFGMSQPSASARLRGLERQLGVKILDRASTGARATVEGSLVAEWASRVLEASNDLMLGAQALRGSTGALRVASSLTIAEYILPAAVRTLRCRRADVRVQLEVANSAAVLRAVRSGDVELGFIESPDDVDDLETVVVAHDELIVVVGPLHPWALRRSPVSAEMFAAAPLVLRERGSGTREFLARAMGSAGLSMPDPMFEVSSTAALKAAAAHGSELTVLSRLAVAADLRSGGLCAVAVDGLDLQRALRATWRGRTQRPAAQELVDAVRAEASSP